MYFDLSPPLDEKYAVWPSDLPLKFSRKVDQKKGHSVNITSFNATTHLGSYAVCSQMTDCNEPSIGQVSFEIFIGLCQVIELSIEPHERITLDHLPPSFKAPRVLIRTKRTVDFKHFDPHYPAVDPSVFSFLATCGVKLLGLDTPGVDFYTDCTQVLSQKEASRYKIPLLLNLWLEPIKPGLYELIALPLRLVGSEASPVRALLRELSDERKKL